MTVKDYIVIGGGSAGFAAIKTLREEDESASIFWITNEDRTPYKRTHINKNIALGFKKEDFALMPHEWLVDKHIEVLYDNVTYIDSDRQALSFSHRGELRYKKLIIATGKYPRKIKIEGYNDHVHNVYTARHIENIIRQSNRAKSILIIGAGVEGVETASQLVSMDKKVVILERNTNVLHHYFNDRFSSLMVESIKKAGVELITEAQSIRYNESKKTFSINNNKYQFDIVISTIGYQPNIQLAEDSKLACNKGILVNEFLETSVENIYAAGDVAEHPNGQITGLWHAAEQQGGIAAKNASGQKVTNQLPPFRMKTEVFGDFYFSVPPKSKDYDAVLEENGSTIRELYFDNNKLKAVLMKNDKERAKLYQKALMEEWTKIKVKNQLSL